MHITLLARTLGIVSADLNKNKALLASRLKQKTKLPPDQIRRYYPSLVPPMSMADSTSAVARNAPTLYRSFWCTRYQLSGKRRDGLLEALYLSSVCLHREYLFRRRFPNVTLISTYARPSNPGRSNVRRTTWSSNLLDTTSTMVKDIDW